MYDALTARGIDPARLILEERSANTRQNLQNSLALLPDDYHKTVAIVTNDFHMGRVRLLLNAAGPGRVVQVPAKLPWWLAQRQLLPAGELRRGERSGGASSAGLKKFPEIFWREMVQQNRCSNRLIA